MLKPVKNITIPIHEKCHKLITSDDVAALTAFAYKLEKETKQLKSKVGALVTMLDNFSIFKLSKKKGKK